MTNDDSIEQAISRVLAGDDDAWATVVLRIQAPLFGYLGRLGLDAASAEDVAQETLLRGWRELHRFDRSRASLSTWLHTIARNLAFDAMARTRRMPVGDNGALEQLEGGVGPDIAFELRERQRRIERAMHALGLDDRSALALAYTQGLGLAQAAAIEGCSTATFRVRLHRARARLKQLIERQASPAASPKLQAQERPNVDE